MQDLMSPTEDTFSWSKRRPARQGASSLSVPRIPGSVRGTSSSSGATTSFFLEGWEKPKEKGRAGDGKKGGVSGTKRTAGEEEGEEAGNRGKSPEHHEKRSVLGSLPSIFFFGSQKFLHHDPLSHTHSLTRSRQTMTPRTPNSKTLRASLPSSATTNQSCSPTSSERDAGSR